MVIWVDLIIIISNQQPLKTCQLFGSHRSSASSKSPALILSTERIFSYSSSSERSAMAFAYSFLAFSISFFVNGLIPFRS